MDPSYFSVCGPGNCWRVSTELEVMDPALSLFQFQLFLKEKQLKKCICALCMALYGFIKVDLGDFLCDTQKAA
jgi:hypothetical protein